MVAAHASYYEAKTKRRRVGQQSAFAVRQTYVSAVDGLPIDNASGDELLKTRCDRLGPLMLNRAAACKTDLAREYTEGSQDSQTEEYISLAGAIEGRRTEDENDDQNFHPSAANCEGVFRCSTINEADAIISEDGHELKFILEEEQNLVVIGIFDLVIVRGSVTFLGAHLSAPSTIHQITLLNSDVITPLVARPQTELLIRSCQTNKHASIMSKLLIPPPGVLQSIKSSTFTIIISIKNPNMIYSTPALPGISEMFDCKQRQYRVMVAGCKSYGAWPICREAINSLLMMTASPVYYLETECFQPALGPPSLITLYSIERFCLNSVESCDHLLKIVKSHHFGHTLIRHDLEKYKRSILDLLEHYGKAASATSSLIIHCQISKDQDEEFWESIRASVDVHAYVKLSEESKLSTLSIADTHVMCMLGPRNALLGTEMRLLNLKSYFNDLYDVPSTTDLFAVKFAALGGVIFTNFTPTATTNAIAGINGTIIALLCISKSLIDSEYLLRASPSTEQDISILTMKSSLLTSNYRCLGLGFVKAVNLKTQELHILTPALMTGACRSNECLLIERGTIETPIWLMGPDNNEDSPYTTDSFGFKGFGGQIKHIRRNVLRNIHRLGVS